MAFPFLFEENFERGDKGIFDGTTVDTTSILDFPHYSTLARIPGLPAPYRGAYCARVVLSGGTTEAYLLEDTTWDMAASENQFWRFQLYLSSDFVMANNDQFVIWQLNNAEAVVTIKFTTAAGFQIGIGETAGTNFLDISLGVWHSVEIDVTLDDGVGGDGTLDMFLDGGAAIQVASLTQAAITSGRLGVIGPDAGTSGTVLFDMVSSDDARLFPLKRRWDETILMTQSGHALVGPCEVTNASLISGNVATLGDAILKLYDTDSADLNGELKLELRNTADFEVLDPAGMPLSFTYGCYVDLQPKTIGATQSKALIQLGCHAVAYGSDGAVRRLGLKRNWVM